MKKILFLKVVLVTIWWKYIKLLFIVLFPQFHNKIFKSKVLDSLYKIVKNSTLLDFNKETVIYFLTIKNYNQVIFKFVN